MRSSLLMTRPATRAIAGLVVFALGVGGWPASGQQPSVAPLDALVGPFLAELATIRGLPWVGAPPPIVIRSRSETRRYVEQELNRKYPVAQVEAERKAMVAWGLIPAEFDLRGFFLDLLAEQAAAYYDPVGKVLVLADWLAPEQQRAALLHELVHALQDREMPLDQFLTPTPGKGDQLLARQALVEGEAVALSLELVLKAQGLELREIPDFWSFQQRVVAQSAGPVFDRAPRFLREQLLFPYTQGLQFVQQFRRREPWSAVGRLYRDPPRSTAQILHPETILDRREDPVPVTLPDLTLAFPPGWQRVDEDELGEWTLGAVLEQYPAQAAARDVATGWRGDRYQIWEAGQDQLLVYRVTWETEQKAEAFAQAYQGVLESKHPALKGNAAKSAGSTWAWQEGQQRFLVERRGRDVVVLEQVPALAAQQIRQAVWAASPLTPAPTR